MQGFYLTTVDIYRITQTLKCKERNSYGKKDIINGIKEEISIFKIDQQPKINAKAECYNQLSFYLSSGMIHQ